MSPEQAEGRSAILDHRTDIYSLGITLYEFLTLRPAFPAEDRQTLLKLIAQDEPAAPHKLNPAISADLETILLKATRKEPAERYSSAGQFGADLRRFLNQQPIKARRVSNIDRGRRWISRHTALVAAAFGTLAIIAASGITATVLTLNAYDAEAEQRAKAETNLALAHENLRIASEAIEKMMIRVASDPAYIGNVHRAEGLIADAVRFHERLLAQTEDPQIKINAATTHRRAVWIHYQTGLLDKAERACTRASEILAQLVETDPDCSDYLHALANNELEFARIRRAIESIIVHDSTLYGVANGVETAGYSVFRMNADGSDYEILQSFSSDNWTVTLTLVGDTLYGTTTHDGDFGSGSIFAIPIPEPSSIVLTLIALAAASIATIARRRDALSNRLTARPR